MAQKRRTGLGRGLGALIPQASPTESPVDVFFGQEESQATTSKRRAATPASTKTSLVEIDGLHLTELSPAQIRPNPRQPRTEFDQDQLQELSESITEVGLLQPIVVRSVPDGSDGKTYELIMGERRLRAAMLAGLKTIPAIVKETDDNDLLRDALLENLHRSQLNPLEEAAAYQQLLDDFSCTHEELSQRIHRSRPQISNTLRLLKLPSSVQRRVAAGVLSSGHARALLALPTAEEMEAMALRIVAEGLSVRTTEELVSLAEPAKRTSHGRGRTQQLTPGIQDLTTRLTDTLDTRVKVSMGKNKGRITIEFATIADLNRVVHIMSPGDPGVPESEG